MAVPGLQPPGRCLESSTASSYPSGPSCPSHLPSTFHLLHLHPSPPRARAHGSLPEPPALHGIPSLKPPCLTVIVELLLFARHVHIQPYPSYVTLGRFLNRPLCALESSTFYLLI